MVFLATPGDVSLQILDAEVGITRIRGWNVNAVSEATGSENAAFFVPSDLLVQTLVQASCRRVFVDMPTKGQMPGMYCNATDELWKPWNDNMGRMLRRGARRKSGMECLV